MFSCLKLCYPIGRVVHAGLQPILKNINPCSSVAICAIRVLYRISYDYKSAPAVKYFEILSVLFPRICAPDKIGFVLSNSYIWGQATLFWF